MSRRTDATLARGLREIRAMAAALKAQRNPHPDRLRQFVHDAELLATSAITLYELDVIPTTMEARQQA